MCDAGIFEGTDTTCNAVPGTVRTIESSLNFIHQKCEVIPVGNVSLYLLLRPVCRTDGETTVEDWDICSYQPSDGSNLLCKALGGLECCDELHDFFVAEGIDSNEGVSCEKFQPGECHTIHGYNGFGMVDFNLKLSNCAGDATAPRCKAEQTAESGFFSSMSRPASMELLGMGLVLLAVGMLIRRRNNSDRGDNNDNNDSRVERTTRNAQRHGLGRSVYAAISSPFNRLSREELEMDRSIPPPSSAALRDGLRSPNRESYEALVDWDECGDDDLEHRPLLR